VRTQAQVKTSGHSIECRLYAERPAKGFLPSPGLLSRFDLPGTGADVRIDTGVRSGDRITHFYDPMIAKLIVHDRDRVQALQRLRDALAVCEIDGPKSNIAFLERLARHPTVVEGRIDTGYLDRRLDEFLGGHLQPSASVLFAAATAALMHDEHAVRQDAETGSDPHSPWARADAWRIGHAGKRIVALTLHEVRHEVEAWGHGGDYRLRYGDATCAVREARFDRSELSARFDGEALRLPLRADAQRVLLHDGDGRRYRFTRAAAFAWAAAETGGADHVAAPMPGRIVLVKAAVGDRVAAGQELLVMEAMKMELALKAPRDGVIEAIGAAAGDFVEADAVLVRFAAGDPA
jgi:3-methylcrotonyl-CoA carboxylase alpha subunit